MLTTIVMFTYNNLVKRVTISDLLDQVTPFLFGRQQYQVILLELNDVIPEKYNMRN